MADNKKQLAEIDQQKNQLDKEKDAHDKAMQKGKVENRERREREYSSPL